MPLVAGDQINSSWPIDFMSDACGTAGAFARSTASMISAVKRGGRGRPQRPATRVIRTPERIAPGAATTKPRLDIELTAKSSVVSRRARPRPRPPRTGFFDCPLLSKDARGSPRSRRSPDVTMVNTRSGGRPRQARARRVSSAERAVNLQFSLALIYGESHNVRVSILPPRIVVRVQH